MKRFNTLNCVSYALFLALAQTGVAVADTVEKDYQVHGFASQGYILTDENNFYGDSEDGGSFDYYEVGLNGIWQFNDTLSVSAQALARDAGETDDGKLRIDYLFVDYRFIQMDMARAGLRLGRVKNPIGFYNESRDVLFTRPSILLPQSIYLEGTGIRELLFSSDGLQLYGDWDHGQHHTSFKMNFATSEEVTGQTRENFLGGTAVFPGYTLDSLKLSDLLFVQLMDEIDGGRLRFGMSYVSATLDARFTSTMMPSPLNASLDSDIAVLSAQYNREFWSLTAEYSLRTTKLDVFGMSEQQRSDGFYLQGQYRLTPKWTGLLRYDLSYGDRNDRGSSDARDLTAGLSWSPNASWLVMGEYHYLHGSDGASGLPSIDNPQGASDRTNMLVLMLGYRF